MEGSSHNRLMKIHRKRYRKVSAEIIDRHLRTRLGYALIRYRYDDIEIIVPAYAYNIYLPIPEDAERIIG